MNQQYDPNKPAIEQPDQNKRPEPKPDQSGGPDRSQDRDNSGTSQPKRTDVEREERVPEEDE